MEQRERAKQKLGQLDGRKAVARSQSINTGFKQQDMGANYSEQQHPNDDKLVSDKELENAQEQLKNDKKLWQRLRVGWGVPLNGMYCMYWLYTLVLRCVVRYSTARKIFG